MSQNAYCDQFQLLEKVKRQPMSEVSVAKSMTDLGVYSAAWMSEDYLDYKDQSTEKTPRPKISTEHPLLIPPANTLLISLTAEK